MNAICAIDLDTILPILAISKIKFIPRIYDAHELFTELKEVVTRPIIKKSWLAIENFALPKFNHGYTVCDSIAEEFYRRYNLTYKVIRNVPLLSSQKSKNETEKFLLYQGAVNEGRCFEHLIPALKFINCKLVIAGNGNFMKQLKILISENKVEEKVELLGMVVPEKLSQLTEKAYLGISLVENLGLNQYWSLANKFFDYFHAGIPQITMNYPEYKKINQQFEVAILINDLKPKTIAEAINKLLTDESHYLQLKSNCVKAKEELNWQIEEKLLLNFYNTIFNN